MRSHGLQEGAAGHISLFSTPNAHAGGSSGAGAEQAAFETVEVPPENEICSICRDALGQQETIRLTTCGVRCLVSIMLNCTHSALGSEDWFMLFALCRGMSTSALLLPALHARPPASQQHRLPQLPDGNKKGADPRSRAPPHPDLDEQDTPECRQHRQSQPRAQDDGPSTAGREVRCPPFMTMAYWLGPGLDQRHAFQASPKGTLPLNPHMCFPTGGGNRSCSWPRCRRPRRPAWPSKTLSDQPRPARRSRQGEERESRKRKKVVLTV